MPNWHTEDEILYDDAEKCLKVLSQRYKIGIIANQSLGIKERLEQHGVLKFINLVIASAKEGVAKLLGFYTIWIRQGFGKYWIITDEIERADYIVDNLTELCDIL